MKNQPTTSKPGALPRFLRATGTAGLLPAIVLLLGIQSSHAEPPTPRGLAKNIYISVRTDGTHGSGTPEDPFDGSTQPLFDAIFTRYAGQNNLTFILETGAFSTNGSGGLIDTGWKGGDGWQIIGAGKDVTTITQQRILDNSTFTRGANGVIVAGYDCLVEDLTVDCNYAVLHTPPHDYAHSSNFGVQLKSGAIRNVHVIGAGGTDDPSNPPEVFALGFLVSSSDPTQPDQALIENCTVDGVEGNHVTSIWAAAYTGNPGTPGGGTATISHCVVNGNNGTSGIAYQINGYKNCLVDGCTSTGTFNGFFHDTWAITNLKVTNCSFSGQGPGIALVGSYLTDVVQITDNTLTLTADSTNIKTDSATHVVIKGNTLIAGGTIVHPIQTNSNATTTDIEGNEFSSNTSTTLQPNCSLVGRFRDNRYQDGTAYSLLADNSSSVAIIFANKAKSPAEGTIQAFTDSNTATWGATITGGGLNHVLGYYDGQFWTVQGK